MFKIRILFSLDEKISNKTKTIRQEFRMNKGILALGAMLILGVNTSSNAAKVWRGDIDLISYQNEAQAEKDFQQGKCDGVYMTSMRARTYNKFAGSVDAIGAVPTYAIAQKAISFALDKRNQRRLVSRVGNQS